MTQPRTGLRQILAALLALLALTATLLAQAAPQDDAQLVDRISSEVVKKLQASGALDLAIDAGIKRYLARQRAAHAAAVKQREEEAQRKAAKVPAPDPASDHIYGNPKAMVSLIEYSDFECPFCKRFAPVAKSLVDESGGKVNWVYRHFPLGFHNPVSEHESEGAECVAELGGNDAFWKYVQRLYALTAANGKGIPGGDLEKLATDVGVEGAAFQACVKSGRHADVIKKDYAEGIAVGVSGTPGNILRNNRTGKVLVRAGALPLASMQAAVAELLNPKAEQGGSAKAGQ